jgi:hypothetical protein
MTTATREQVANALFNLLVGSSQFLTTGRRFLPESQIASAAKPALFLLDDDEQHTRGKQLVPAVRETVFECLVFISAGLDPNAVPSATLSNLIDVIDPVSGGVLKPGINGRQTLGGLVTDCYIEGKVIKAPGDISGLGAARIPIKVIWVRLL